MSTVAVSAAAALPADFSALANCGLIRRCFEVGCFAVQVLRGLSRFNWILNCFHSFCSEWPFKQPLLVCRAACLASAHKKLHYCRSTENWRSPQRRGEKLINVTISSDQETTETLQLRVAVTNSRRVKSAQSSEWTTVNDITHSWSWSFQ